MAPAAIVEPANQPSISRRDTSPTRIRKRPGDASIVEYRDEYEQLNSKYRLAWGEWMGEGSRTTSSHYKKVSVLLISWDEDFDDLHTKEEVNNLERVFSQQFNYKVTNVRITCDEKAKLAQVQVNYYLSRFVNDEDDTKTLLIIYYAGHGIPGSKPGHLELAGKCVPSDDHDKINKVIWNHAEFNLQNTNADIFEIFDCCYAGNIGRTRGYEKRSFEYLAAASAGSTTRSPGKNSFTSAMIWALEDLVKTRKRFTTSQLVIKIREAPGFPRGQYPTLDDCFGEAVDRIVLAPLVNDEDAKEQIEQPGNQEAQPAPREVLNLKFFFGERPKERHLERLAQALRTMNLNQELQIRRLTWGGLQPAGVRLQSVVHEATNRFKTRRPLSTPASTPTGWTPTGFGRTLASPAPGGSSDELSSFSPPYNIEYTPETIRVLPRPRTRPQASPRDLTFHFKMLLFCTWAIAFSVAAAVTEKKRAFMWYIIVGLIASWALLVSPFI